MMIAPRNPADDVTQFLDLLRLDGDEVVTLIPNDPLTMVAKKLQPSCTWRRIAEEYLDICGTPKRLVYDISLNNIMYLY